MALLVVNEKKVETEKVAQGVIAVICEGETVGTVERLARESYRSSTGRLFPAQVSAIRDCVCLWEAQKVIFH